MNATWDGTLTGDDRIDDTLQSFKTIRAIQASNAKKVPTGILFQTVEVLWMWHAYSP